MTLPALKNVLEMDNCCRLEILVKRTGSYNRDRQLRSLERAGRMTRVSSPPQVLMEYGASASRGIGR